MNASLSRVLAGYRLLYLRGLLLDGQYRLPASGGCNGESTPAPRRAPRQRMLLAALTGLRHLHLFTRNRS